MQNRHTTFKFMVCKNLAIQGLNDNTFFIPYKGGSFLSAAIRIVTLEVIHLIYVCTVDPYRVMSEVLRSPYRGYNLQVAHLFSAIKQMGTSD